MATVLATVSEELRAEYESFSQEDVKTHSELLAAVEKKCELWKRIYDETGLDPEGAYKIDPQTGKIYADPDRE